MDNFRLHLQRHADAVFIQWGQKKLQFNGMPGWDIRIGERTAAGHRHFLGDPVIDDSSLGGIEDESDRPAEWAAHFVTAFNGFCH